MKNQKSSRECEMCGSEAPTFPVEIDGVKLSVCSKCSKFGSPVKRKPPARPKFSAPKPKLSSKKAVPERKPVRAPRKDYFNDKILLDGYGDIIRTARAEKGVGRAQFASMIKEKETLLARIETERVVPTDRIVEKIERELDIELKTEVVQESSAAAEYIPQSTTIGSIAKIKRKKKTND